MSFSIKLKSESYFNENDLLPLVELGLNKYEASIYLTLVNEGTQTAKEISNITGVPYGKIYEMIDSLAAKGFVYVIPSKPMRYHAISPKKAVETAKNTIQRKLTKLEQHAINELEPRFQSGKQFLDPRGAFLLMKGRANIVRKIEEFLKTATSSVNILTTENGLKRLVVHKDLLRDAKERGVDIKVAAPHTEGNKEDLKILAFCDVKHVDPPFSSLFSFDGKTTIVIETIPDDENYVCGRDQGMVSMSPSFSSFLNMFYDTYYENSVPGRIDG